MTKTGFWKPQPREPWSDWRTYSMLVPILFSALGSMIFMALGFSFTEMESIGAIAQTRLVVIAAFTVAFGSTFGSVGSGIEIFSKVHKKQVGTWDWIALCVSGATTVAGFGMGFAALLGATAGWSAVAQIYGCVVVGTLAALDSTCDMIELGGLFGSYEMRMEQYLEDKAKWEEAQREEEEQDPATWETADIDDFRRITAGMNGNRPKTVKELLPLLAKDHLQPPTRQTMGRWLNESEKARR